MREDEIALAIEIRGLYDGAAVYLLRDGTLVNKFRGKNWGGHYEAAADEWIAKYGEELRRSHIHLLDPGALDE